MFKSLSHKFANILVENKVIENGDFEIYRYGFETLTYFIVNISVALFIGVIFDMFIHTIIFLSCYCTLRQFTGGYHARNYTECTLNFVCMYLLTIIIVNNINMDKYKYLLILLMMISIFIIYKLAPLEHRNKPLSEIEKNKYRYISIKIAFVAGSIFTFYIMMNVLVEYFIFILFAMIWNCILLILGFYNNRLDLLTK